MAAFFKTPFGNLVNLATLAPKVVNGAVQWNADVTEQIGTPLQARRYLAAVFGLLGNIGSAAAYLEDLTDVVTYGPALLDIAPIPFNLIQPMTISGMGFLSSAGNLKVKLITDAFGYTFTIPTTYVSATQMTAQTTATPLITSVTPAGFNIRSSTVTIKGSGFSAGTVGLLYVENLDPSAGIAACMDSNGYSMTCTFVDAHTLTAVFNNQGDGILPPGGVVIYYRDSAFNNSLPLLATVDGSQNVTMNAPSQEVTVQYNPAPGPAVSNVLTGKMDGNLNVTLAVP